MSDGQKIHEALIQQAKTLALAESCTGGHLSSHFTSLPDASKYFLGSFVAYSNGMKENILGVSKTTLKNHGAVSRETAHEMWIGLMKQTGADYGISVTGTAGPSGGTKEKPVGLVYICLGEKGKKPHVFENQFEGNRLEVISSTIETALSELVLFLEL